ncbi:MAG: SDR family oxidoreductase [Cyanobacteria bacterium SBLK]|nr:SDR family oxidoreductase [Cyanobacteria bacterium SBLK]
MKKLLVTGSSGFLGWNLCQIATRNNWQVFGAYYSHSPNLPKIVSQKIDLTDFQSLKVLFSEIKPDAVIHLAAVSKPNYCQTHPEESYRINVTTSHHIADLCAESEIPCAFTSTDLVFDGLNPPYRESDRVCPVSIYGEQKVFAERGMLERYPKTAVCRMPLMFGPASPHSPSFIQSFIAKLRREEELALFFDEYRMPVSAETATRGLFLALEKAVGILHLGGKERLSRYEFGNLMTEVLELPRTGLKSCSQKDVPMPAPRPVDLAMDSSKAFNLGYNPPTIREELEALKGKV